MNYIVTPTIQIVDKDGKPLSNGKVYVYNAGTTNLATVYKDFNGTLNTNPIVLDSIGHCTIIADETKHYDIIIKNPNDTILFSIENVYSIAVGGAGSNVIVTGTDKINVSSTVLEDGTTKYVVSLDSSIQQSIESLSYKYSTLRTYVDYMSNNVSDIQMTVDSLSTAVARKQNKLTAGTNITIDENNKISSSITAANITRTFEVNVPQGAYDTSNMIIVEPNISIDVGETVILTISRVGIMDNISYFICNNGFPIIEVPVSDKYYTFPYTNSGSDTVSLGLGFVGTASSTVTTQFNIIGVHLC